MEGQRERVFDGHAGPVYLPKSYASPGLSFPLEIISGWTSAEGLVCSSSQNHRESCPCVWLSCHWTKADNWSRPSRKNAWSISEVPGGKTIMYVRISALVWSFWSYVHLLKRGRNVFVFFLNHHQPGPRVVFSWSIWINAFLQRLHFQTWRQSWAWQWNDTTSFLAHSSPFLFFHDAVYFLKGMYLCSKLLIRC